MRGATILLILLIIATSAACARKELVVLLPGKDGDTGAVVVRQAEQEVLLDSPHVAARLAEDRRPIETGVITREEIERNFKDALSAQPRAPKSYTLYFYPGTTRLTEASQPELDKMLAEIARRKVPDVQVTGHADRVGDLADNDRLSRRRAREIRRALLGYGLDPDIVSAVGRGEREPLIETPDEVPEPRNRRVEVFVR